jgi:hypothetical protein
MKTWSKTQFRVWLSLSLVFSFAGALLDVFGSHWLPVPLQEWDAFEGGNERTPKDPMVMMLASLCIAASLVNVIALYSLAWWGRPMMVVTWAMGYGIELCMGPSVTLAASTVLYGLSTFVSGVLLGAMYFSPEVSSWFTRRRPMQPPPIPSGTAVDRMTGVGGE